MKGKKGHDIDTCQKCNRCCSYFCVEVDPPESRSEIDDYIWILAHEGVSIHVEEDIWNLMVKNRCRYLGDKSECTIYDRRPVICRKHEPGTCEFNSESDHDYDDVDHIFDDIEKLQAYGDKLFPKKEKKRLSKKRRKKVNKEEFEDEE